jgi:hypothetical protein
MESQKSIDQNQYFDQGILTESDGLVPLTSL